ncbi:MAG TPA: RsmB/NOP family class I SAM-dependent RNA methyltransferase [Paracoccaceae bacterium]|nr:RsmB/NOP family class I SAM-dependent RNA methyltransferase [Paracoccaceae bacterium]
MTPSARIAAAIEIIDIWRAGDEGLDRVLTGWGRAHRFAGSGDRHAIADLVYSAVRRLRSAAFIAGVEEDEVDGRALLRGSLMLDGSDPARFFTGAKYAPSRLTEAETRAPEPLAEAPRAVRLDLPGWLETRLVGVEDDALAALRERAPLDLRVNLLKLDRAKAIEALEEDGIAVDPLPLSPTALRVRERPRLVARSRAYGEGLVEIQDAASQAAADLAGVRPGETVLDLCAGGGGKALALAAALQGQGRVFAHDASPARIAPLSERAARAGAEIEITESGELHRLAGRLDLVFVDAPCSGSGAWRRNADAKWRLTQDMLDGLLAVQDDLLDQAAMLAGPHGRVLYATCSLIRCENEARIDAFLTRNPGWRLSAAKTVTPPEGDGFFAALLVRPDAGNMHQN